MPSSWCWLDTRDLWLHREAGFFQLQHASRQAKVQTMSDHEGCFENSFPLNFSMNFWNLNSCFLSETLEIFIGEFSKRKLKGFSRVPFLSSEFCLHYMIWILYTFVMWFVSQLFCLLFLLICRTACQIHCTKRILMQAHQMFYHLPTVMVVGSLVRGGREKINEILQQALHALIPELILETLLNQYSGQRKWKRK